MLSLLLLVVTMLQGLEATKDATPSTPPSVSVVDTAVTPTIAPGPPSIDVAAIRDAMAISYYPSRREQPSKLEDVSVNPFNTISFENSEVSI